MTTSGTHRTWLDTIVSCRCGFYGWVEACEDREDETFSWDCPGCGHHAVEEWGDERDD